MVFELSEKDLNSVPHLAERCIEERILYQHTEHLSTLEAGPGKLISLVTHTEMPKKLFNSFECFKDWFKEETSETSTIELLSPTIGMSSIDQLRTLDYLRAVTNRYEVTVIVKFNRENDALLLTRKMGNQC